MCRCVCELTSSPEGDHDVGYTTVDAGEPQRSDSSPDLQRPLDRVVHFSHRHVGSVILYPAGGKKTLTALRLMYGRICVKACTEISAFHNTLVVFLTCRSAGLFAIWCLCRTWCMHPHRQLHTGASSSPPGSWSPASLSQWVQKTFASLLAWDSSDWICFY